MFVEDRIILLKRWLDSFLSPVFSIQPMTSGAGLRRYFRVITDKGRFVVMDAQADSQSLAFIHLSKELQSMGVKTPTVHQADLDQGFLLLTDLGDNLYGTILNVDNVDFHYQQAFLTLLRIQAYSQNPNAKLQPFDMKHYREKMNGFIEFFLQAYLRLPLRSDEITLCEHLFDLLINTAKEQPKVCVHYDFHCRNLLSLPEEAVGVLDFQDAVLGPITYDLMSLLRDCYRDWPEVWVQSWREQYHQKALEIGLLTMADPRLWQRWCDFTSLQRHIKCAGLFAKFHISGHSSDYLVYLPRILNYLDVISACYPETLEFKKLLQRIRL